jgi:hypothetical protein
MMEKKDLSKYEKNLVCFLRLFQNRPFHLAKYLSDNDCFRDDFIKNITESKKLGDLSQKYDLGELPNVYFMNFKEMLKFFENISQDYKIEGMDNEKVQEELNSKLNEFIKLEKYEDAIKIRDFMIQNNIKRKEF